MSRATIVIALDQPEEVAAGNLWFATWKEKLSYLSENSGCGCCVDIYEVEGPDEAIAAIPSKWEWKELPDLEA